MKDYIVVVSVIGIIFALLSLIPKSNRNKSILIKNIKGLLIVWTFAITATLIYRNTNSVLGYTLQYNRGLKGGCLCIASTILFYILWFIRINLKKNSAIK